MPDGLGFRWLCTSEGLARYDGVGFRTFTAADGLPHNAVTAVLPAVDGTYWIGTSRGLAHFDPSPRRRGTLPMFRVVAHPDPRPSRSPSVQQYGFASDRLQVFALYQDSSGETWCGTGDGLFRVVNRAGQPQLVPVELGARSPTMVRALAGDREGRLWIGTNSGLYRRDPDGVVTAFGDDGFLEPGVNHNIVTSLRESRDGRLFVGTEHAGLRMISTDARPGASAVARRWYENGAAMNDRVAAILQDRDGVIWWVGMEGARWLRKGVRDDWADAVTGRLGAAEGLPPHVFDTLGESPTGDLWLAGEGVGVTEVSRRGITTFTEADGLPSRSIRALTLARDGTVVVTAEEFRKPWRLGWFDGRRFVPVTVDLGHNDWGWGWGQLAFHDATQRWWIPTGQAVYRSPAGVTPQQLGRVRFERLPTPFPPSPFLRDGQVVTDFSGNPPELQAWSAFRLFEDSRGFVWAGTMNRVGGHVTPNEVVRWDPATDLFQPFPNDDAQFVPMSFAEDGDGNVWIGGYGGGLKVARRGATQLEDRSDLVPANARVRSLAADAHGLWAATGDGLRRIVVEAGGDATRPTSSAVDGVESTDLWSLTTDASGRLFVGHTRGVDIIGASGRVEGRLRPADGLVGGTILSALRDRRGDLWFGSAAGVSRYVPAPTLPPSSVRLVVTELRAGGAAIPVSEVGQTEVEAFSVPAASPVVEVEFAALGVPAQVDVRYQFALDRSGTDWSRPSDRREVQLPGLAAGSYRLVIRAVAFDGTVVSPTLLVPFEVRRPFWAEWWFIAVVIAVVASLLYAFHRTRVARAVAVERVRLSVARDLHDELGGSLARLSILAEVGRRDPSRAEAVLREVSDTARGLVTALGEVVWFVDPRHEHFGALARRVDAYGRETFAGTGVEWSSRVPDEADAVPLSSDDRRHLYLLLKEAVTNAAVHAQATHVAFTCEVTASSIRAEVRDDGAGPALPPPMASTRGKGTSNMQERADALRASLGIDTSRSGTVVSLDMPRMR